VVTMVPLLYFTRTAWRDLSPRASPTTRSRWPPRCFALNVHIVLGPTTLLFDDSDVNILLGMLDNTLSSKALIHFCNMLPTFFMLFMLLLLRFFLLLVPVFTFVYRVGIFSVNNLQAHMLAANTLQVLCYNLGIL
jgi:hypothetical protein